MPLVRVDLTMIDANIFLMLDIIWKVTNIFNAEMKKSGHVLNNDICPHFAMSRADLFSIIRVKKLRDFPQVMEHSGTKKDSLGCEICKPAVGSILSSL